MKKGWELKNLGDICKIGTGKSNTEDAIANGKFAFFDRSKIIKRSSKYLLDCDAIIVAGEGQRFFPKFFSGKFDLHQRAYAIYSFRNDVSIHYAYKYLIHFHKYFEEVAVGATAKSLRLRHFQELPIPVPPLEEQKQIVAILDKAFKAIDKAKENAEKNLKNAKELFESYLQEVFENKGDDWEVKCLNELGTITSSKRIYKSEYVKDGVPFYRTKEIKELSNQKKIKIELFILRERYEEIKKSFGVPQIGDLLMSAVGTIGEIMVINNDNEFYFKDGNIVWFKNFETLDTDYLKFALTAFVEKIKSLAIGAAYSALTIEKLNKYQISFPKPLEEQKKIVTKLENLQAKAKSLEDIYQQKLSNLEELKKSILQKAFNGELSNKLITT
jgi:type I restriction enzyme, S subunit